jgi:hypothetical protein
LTEARGTVISVPAQEIVGHFGKFEEICDLPFKQAAGFRSVLEVQKEYVGWDGLIGQKRTARRSSNAELIE